MSKIKIKYDQLQTRCTQTEHDIVASIRGFKELKGGVNSAWFKSNGSTVLAVAHMDTVQSKSYFGMIKIVNDSVIYSPKLDDRVGVYTVLDMLPSLGIKTDILLTTDEEKCQSSARLFNTGKQYNWLVEFDRRGEDIVTYGMTSRVFEDELEACKFKIGMGSYSDICDLTHLGVCAMNVGVGYEDAHNLNARMSVGAYVRNLKRFLSFYHKNKDVIFDISDTYDQCDMWYDAVRPNHGELFNDLTGNVIHVNNQRCRQCNLLLDYWGNDQWYCNMCDTMYEYNYHREKLEEAIYDKQLDT